VVGEVATSLMEMEMAATINGALFKEIMAEMRENTLKRLTSPTAVAASEEESRRKDLPAE